MSGSRPELRICCREDLHHRSPGGGTGHAGSGTRWRRLCHPAKRSGCEPVCRRPADCDRRAPDERPLVLGFGLSRLPGAQAVNAVCPGPSGTRRYASGGSGQGDRPSSSASPVSPQRTRRCCGGRRRVRGRLVTSQHGAGRAHRLRSSWWAGGGVARDRHSERRRPGCDCAAAAASGMIARPGR